MSEVQLLNAYSSMFVTLSGMITDVRKVHLRNALSPMLVTLSGIMTSVSEVQP